MSKNKSAWELARKNFIQIAFLVLIIDIIIIGMYIAGVDAVKSSFTIMGMLPLVAVTLSWFYIASLFKNRNKNAINISYGFLGVMLLWNSLHGINFLLILIFAYLFYVVYKASKENQVESSEVPTPNQ